MLLWANLHAAFTIGFVIAVFAFLDFLERTRLSRKDVLLSWVVFLALSALVTLIHPYSWQAMFATLSVVTRNEAVPQIAEWQPFNAQTEIAHEVALLTLIFLAVVSGFRLGWAKALLIVLLLHLFLTHVRYSFFLFPILPILLAPEMARQFPKLSAEGWRAQPRDALEKAMSTSLPAWVAVLAGGLFLLACLQAVLLPTAPKSSAGLAEAMRYVRSNNVTGNVLNHYDFGGPLIFNGIKTFLDGRTDQLFHGDFARKFMTGPRTEPEMAEALEEYDIRWTMLPPKDPRLALLDKMPGWKRVFTGETAIIHQRQEKAAQ